jgi:hypothetical protein
MSVLDSLIRRRRRQLASRREYLDGLARLAANLKRDAMRLGASGAGDGRGRALVASIRAVESQIAQEHAAFAEAVRQVEQWQRRAANRKKAAP